MRIKGPTIRKGDGGVRVSASEVNWCRNPIKGLLYRCGLNQFNKILFKYFEKEIEL